MAGYSLDDPRLWQVVEEQAAETAANWPVDQLMLSRLQPLLAVEPPASAVRRAPAASRPAVGKRAA